MYMVSNCIIRRKTKNSTALGEYCDKHNYPYAVACFIVHHNIKKFDTIDTCLGLFFLYKQCYKYAVLLSFPYIGGKPNWIEMELPRIK